MSFLSSETTRPFLAARDENKPRNPAILNGDGKPDLVSVRMDVYQPFTPGGRVVLWLNHRGQVPSTMR